MRNNGAIVAIFARFVNPFFPGGSASRAGMSARGAAQARRPMPKLVSRPVGNFETADDQRLNMARSTKPAFTRLRDDTERPEWKEKYATVKVRLAEHEYLTAECAAWFKSRACAGAKSVCDRAGAPVSKLMSVKDIFEAPRYAPAAASSWRRTTRASPSRRPTSPYRWNSPAKSDGAAKDGKFQSRNLPQSARLFRRTGHISRGQGVVRASARRQSRRAPSALPEKALASRHKRAKA